MGVSTEHQGLTLMVPFDLTDGIGVVLSRILHHRVIRRLVFQLEA